MLQELAKNHKKWLKIAYDICKDYDYSNDLVQEMYIKLHDNKKEINDAYIFMVLRSIYIDEIRKEKKVKESEQTFTYHQEEESTKENKEVLIDIINSNYQSLKVYERLIIRYSYRDGLRQFARESGISKELVTKIRNKLKNKIWEDLKKYEGREMSLQILPQQLELNLATVVINEKTLLI